MFNKTKIEELKAKIEKIYEDQRSFIEYATRILQSVEKNDKLRFVWEVREEEPKYVEIIKQRLKL